MRCSDIRTLLVPMLLLIGGCGGGGGTVDELRIAGTPGDDGVFDPAPAWDGASTLWMSHSSVNWSPNDSALSQVHTRIAMSQDNGARWVDAGVDPNNSHLLPDFQVTVGADTVWATWRFEVSRLFYDPYDSDANRRWKILWHRLLAIGDPTPMALHQDGWIGYSSAPSPDASWAAERKLFTGSLYNSTDMNLVIGPPEFPLDVNYSTDLGGCTVFTEPGVLARNDGLYISLQCTGEKKIILLRCDRAFSACDYLGDLLTAADAAAFAANGVSFDLFGAPEFVDTAAATYLVVTGIIDQPPNRYSGCLVFRVADLANADVERNNGTPVLISRVEGSVGSFNGACGYDSRAEADGIIYSEYMPTISPRFHLFSSHTQLP